MSSPDKPKPHLRDRLREKRKTRKQKAIDRGRRDNAAREATQGETRPPSGGTGSFGV